MAEQNRFADRVLTEAEREAMKKGSRRRALAIQAFTELADRMGADPETVFNTADGIRELSKKDAKEFRKGLEAALRVWRVLDTDNVPLQPDEYPGIKVPNAVESPTVTGGNDVPVVLPEAAPVVDTDELIVPPTPVDEMPGSVVGVTVTDHQQVTMPDEGEEIPRGDTISRFVKRVLGEQTEFDPANPQAVIDEMFAKGLVSDTISDLFSDKVVRIENPRKLLENYFAQGGDPDKLTGDTRMPRYYVVKFISDIHNRAEEARREGMKLVEQTPPVTEQDNTDVDTPQSATWNPQETMAKALKEAEGWVHDLVDRSWGRQAVRTEEIRREETAVETPPAAEQDDAVDVEELVENPDPDEQESDAVKTSPYMRLFIHDITGEEPDDLFDGRVAGIVYKMVREGGFLPASRMRNGKSKIDAEGRFRTFLETNGDLYAVAKAEETDIKLIRQWFDYIRAKAVTERKRVQQTSPPEATDAVEPTQPQEEVIPVAPEPIQEVVPESQSERSVEEEPEHVQVALQWQEILGLDSGEVAALRGLLNSEAKYGDITRPKIAVAEKIWKFVVKNFGSFDNPALHLDGFERYLVGKIVPPDGGRPESVAALVKGLTGSQEPKVVAEAALHGMLKPAKLYEKMQKARETDSQNGIQRVEIVDGKPVIVTQ